MSQKKILAIDAATRNTGLAVFNNTKLVHYECVSASGEDLIARILKMISRIKQVYEQYEITNVIVEQPLPEEVKHNQNTYKALMYLQAAIVIALYRYKQKVQFYVASHWRRVCGIQTGMYNKRNQLKENSKALVKQKYGIDVNDDIADAILIGYAYVQENCSAF